MFKKLFICLLVAFVPLQSWAVIDMGFQHQQKAQQAPKTAISKLDHACHQNRASIDDDAHVSQKTADSSGCNSCTLCMAIGFLQTPQAIHLTDSFSQAFHSISQPLIGVDIPSLTKPPIR